MSFYGNESYFLGCEENTIWKHGQNEGGRERIDQEYGRGH